MRQFGRDVGRRTFLRGGVIASGLGLAGIAASDPSDAETVASPVDILQPPAVVGADDPRYGDLVVGNNARWVAHPDSIILAGEASQVAEAVQGAVSAGKRLSIRSGGHCYADFVLNPEVKVVLDVSRLDDVYFDSKMGAFAVESGGTLLEVYKKLYRGWGVTIPGGMCYSVGVGGHIAGGGYGLLSRRHGTTVDHLCAVEVVLVDRNRRVRTVIATNDPADPNRDLWWAHTGGGGGNFGVVTKYFFRSPGMSGTSADHTLIAPPRSVLVSALGIPWDSIDATGFSRMVDAFGRWHEQNTSVASAGADLCSFLMMNHRANGTMGLLTVIDADAPNAADVLNRFLSSVLGAAGVSARSLDRPAGEIGAMPGFDAPQELPWLHSMELLGTNNPTLTSPTLRGHHKSAYMKQRFTPDQISAMYQNLTRTDLANPQSMVVLLSYGGQINSRPSDATASTQRSSLFKGLFQSFWNGAENDAANVQWTRDVYSQVFQQTGGYPVPGPATDGCYINYPDADIRDPQQNRSGVPWSTLYYGHNYPRLQQVKLAYDPLNVFHHSQSIELPARHS